LRVTNAAAKEHSAVDIAKFRNPVDGNPRLWSQRIPRIGKSTREGI